MINKSERAPVRNPNFAVFIAMVSLLSVFNTVLAYFPTLDPALVDVVLLFNSLLEVIFIVNFAYRFITAGSKARYFSSGNGIIDLLACIPFIEVAWLFRGLKALSVFYGLGYDRFKKNLSRERAEATVYIVLFVVMLVLEFGSYAVLVAERSDPAATIKTSEQAVWWAYVTVTTVGYGDYTPLTLGGRIVGIIVMTAGIGTYALLAGFFARGLIGQKEKKNEPEKEDEGRPIMIGDKELTKYLLEREHKEKELTERLGRIEEALTSRGSEK
jgi:voltage-gated potassium channel